MFNKQWGVIVMIAYIDNYGFAVDTIGIQHNIKALRSSR